MHPIPPGNLGPVFQQGLQFLRYRSLFRHRQIRQYCPAAIHTLAVPQLHFRRHHRLQLIQMLHY
jgi:hypothetical protein